MIKDTYKKQVSLLLEILPEIAKEELKLICTTLDAMVKIEVNQINRGIIADTELVVLCDKAQETFDKFCEVRMVSRKQLWGGKTDNDFGDNEYQQTREQLIKMINESLTTEDKKFLFAFSKGEPDWARVDYSKFPAIKWKLLNINKLKGSNPQKHKDQMEIIEQVLFL